MLAHCKPPCLLVLQQQVRLPHRHWWCWLSVKCWQEAQSCVCLSLVQPHLRYSSAPCPSQPGQETLCWREASKQQAAQGDGALLGAGCSQRFTSDVASPAFSDHELPRSLPCLKQLLSVELLFAFPGPPHQAAPRAACCLCPCC